MKPTTRQITWLMCIAGACVMAWAVAGWRADGVAPPDQISETSAAAVRKPSEPTLAPLPAPVPPVEVLASPVSTPASAVQVRRPPFDVSHMQREIQAALNGNERGKARQALKYLHDCWVLRELGERSRERLDADRHRMSEAGYLDALARLDEQQRACQAIDGASRAQWVPLLRRSLAEGDADAAARLVIALGGNFDPVAEPEIVAGLRRDAWACDGLALTILQSMARTRPQLMGLDVAGAVNALARAQITASAQTQPQEKAVLDRELAGLETPAGADPVEVARLVSDMQARCPN